MNPKRAARLRVERHRPVRFGEPRYDVRFLLCLLLIFVSAPVAAAPAGQVKAGGRAERPAPAVATAPERAAIPSFSEGALMAHVRFLAGEELQGRRAGTAFERAAASYIATRLEAAGVASLPPGLRCQNFPLPGGGLESSNVLGYIEGEDPDLKDDVIVLGAHMDHLGTFPGGYYPGAEDNASGVAVVLEVAAALEARRNLLGRSVLVVFFGAEELGKMGSSYFVGHPPLELDRIRCMINADMIGRPLVDLKLASPLKCLLKIDDRNSIGVVGALNRPLFRDAVDAACTRAKIQAFGTRRIPLLSSIVEMVAKDRGDNAPFERKGIPTLFFGSGESRDDHRPTDTADKLKPKLMGRRAAVIYGVVLSLSKAPREAFPERKRTAVSPRPGQGTAERGRKSKPPPGRRVPIGNERR